MRRLAILMAAVLALVAPALALAQPQEGADHGAGAADSGLEVSEVVVVSQPLSADNKATVAAFVACAVAFITAISILGAAYAVAHVGSAAIGAASEKPEMMGRSLIFVALGEGLAVLGLAVAFVLMFMVLTELVR